MTTFKDIVSGWYCWPQICKEENEKRKFAVRVADFEAQVLCPASGTEVESSSEEADTPRCIEIDLC